MVTSRMPGLSYAVLFIVAFSAVQGAAAAPSSAEPADSGVAAGEVQAVSTDARATEASTKKYSLTCKHEAKIGTRVARRTCMRSSNDEQTRRAAENAVGTMHREQEVYQGE